MMAEFIEVARAKRRMCEAHTGGCSKCKLQKNCSLLSVYAYSDDDVKKLENEVMSWAAEHPEQVYPTWRDALLKCGLLYEQRDNKSGSREIKPNWPEMAKPIPADIAEKLGIEPKEDVC